MCEDNSLSYVKGSTAIPLEDVTYPQHFLKVVEQYKDKTCIKFRPIDQSKPIITHTYGQFYQIINNVISGFKEDIKMNSQDVVCFYLPNCLEYVYAQIAVNCSGCIFMPLNPLYTNDQLSRLLPKVNPRIIITCNALKPKVPSEYKLCLIDAPTADTSVYYFQRYVHKPSSVDYIRKCAETVKPTDSSLYACTSGSTGEPKICVYTQYSLVNPFITLDHSTNVPIEYRRILNFNPMFTTAAHFQVDGALASGATLIITDKFEPMTIIKIIKEEKITNFNGAPSGILALMNHPSFNPDDFKMVKQVVMGGAVVSDELMREATRKMSLELCRSGYGMTELCGVIYLMTTEHGAVQPHYEVRIVDLKTREITKRGIPGEIEVRSKIMMKGYLNNEQANKEAYTEDGWFKTGDEGCIDDKGRLIITGRVKDMIIRGGHNVWPNEIIDVLQKHPNVIQAGCVSVPDRAQGETIVGFVMVNKPTTTEELKEYCKNRLVKFAVPTYIFIMDKLPLTSFGKVYAPKLRTLAVEYIKQYWKEKSENNKCPPTTEVGKQIAQLWSKWFEIPFEAICLETNFYEVGGDSLVGTQTIGLIRKSIPDTPFDLINKCPTLGQLEEYIKNPKLDLVQQQFLDDVAEIRNLNIETIEIKEKNDKYALLTGGNGFLGIHILSQLQKQGYFVYCIVRASNAIDGKHRFVKAASNCGITIDLEKLQVICGDVTLKHLGIGNDYDEIVNKISVVIHNAATVNWNRSYSDLRNINYIGTKNVIEVVKDAKVKLVFVSSIGVAGAVGGKEETPNPDVLPSKANGYIQSKWMNELYLNKLREFGYKIGIIRPAFISGNTQTGASNTDDFVWKLIRLLINSSLSPEGSEMILTPVNLVAEFIIKSIITLPNACNLLPLKKANIQYICETIAKKVNKTITVKPMEQIKQEFTEMAKTGNMEILSLLPSLQMIQSFDLDCSFVKNQNFDASETIESINNEIEYLLKCGFFGSEYADGKTEQIGRAISL